MDQTVNNEKVHHSSTLARLLKLILTTSPWMFIASIITIILSAGANVIGTLFIERLINNYIAPLVKQVQHGQSPNYGPLAYAIWVMLGIYAIGFISNYLFTMLMAIWPKRFNSGYVTICLPTWRICQLLILTKMITAISCHVTPTISIL